ncbi:glycoside hydrolase family protein [Candidatus Laterigemmans baculatus]|uniref:hypothetical protein n=1 Tax=Candidatus Laterigemmans baculatus TaxID=2770505 RepID=UPI001F447403|nr:hypothetical protein [Candidatus Laterigemmans baculatus]
MRSWPIAALAVALLGLVPCEAVQAETPNPIAIGSQRELFVDHHLIDRLESVRLVLHRPRDEGPVLDFDQPWEGLFSGYATVIRDGDRFRLYYRGIPTAGSDGNSREVTCYAESTDGLHWTKPKLRLFEVEGTRENNVILADAAPVTHNFCPMLDLNPAADPEQRYKAIGGTARSGLIAYVSADGVNWKKLQDKPVFQDTGWVFDSQNLAFWSETEQQYVLYYRKAPEGVRAIARATSPDFIHWSEPVMMTYSDTDSSKPSQHLYTNQTQPYFRAPQIYVSTAARFMPGRQVISEEQAEEIDVHPRYFKDTSDAVFMTSRGGTRYDRTFMGAFIRPGIGVRNWVSRTNYPALNLVQTGPAEMSLYVNQDYGQPTAHLHRYSLRLDGFASAQAPYEGGELITKPLTFSGDRLLLNFATSAAGGIRVEIQDASGKPLPGYSLDDAVELIGNEIEREVRWNGGAEVGKIADQPVRLRFVFNDADIYALRFE